MPNVPTPEQAAIISSNARILLVDAVAGSGKTTTLAMVARDWSLRSGSNGYIACLSFTESAKQRFKQKLVLEGAPVNIIPNTVNEFARYGLNCLIRAGHLDRPLYSRNPLEIRDRAVSAAGHVWIKYQNSDDIDFDFSLEENSERINQLLEILRRLKATLVSQRFEEEDFFDFGLYEIANQFNIPVQAVEICVAHENLRCRMPGQFDWQTEDDLVPDLVRILQKNPAAINAIPRPALFLVDEWHDINAAEFELIRLLQRHARIVAVADRDQVIDETRGAELRFSTSYFLDTYKEAVQLPLKKSRRFGQSLARKVSSLATRRVEALSEVHTVLHKVHYQPSIRNSCALVIVDHIVKLHSEEQRIKYADFAIVVREEDQSIEIENALLEREIPYRCDGVVSYLLRPEILMLRAMAHIVSLNYENMKRDSSMTRSMVDALAMFIAYPKDSKTFVTDGLEDPRDSNLEQTKKMIERTPAAIKDYFEGVLCQILEEDSNSTQSWKRRFVEFGKYAANHCAAMSAGEFFQMADSALNLTALSNRVHLSKSQADATIRSIRGFIAYARSFPKMSISDFLNQMERLQNRLSSRTKNQHNRPQLTLTTIKSAKGREWPHVVIPYLQAGEFPRGGSFSHESRFLYVAMTRAQSSLTIAEPALEFRDLFSSLIHGERARTKAKSTSF